MSALDLAEERIADLRAEIARRNVMEEMSMTLTIVELEGRLHCVYLGDYRIAGSKPWGGGKTVRTWNVREADILAALELAKTPQDSGNRT